MNNSDILQICFSGEEGPPSAFCMTKVGEWDSFRNIDMDKEVLTCSLLVNWACHLYCKNEQNFDISSSLL